MTIELNHGDEEEIKALLLGHSVSAANNDRLILDDGTMLKVLPNRGCGGCTSGNYWIEDLNGVPNVITAVELYDAYNEDGETLSIFVYAENEKINLVSVTGDVGNGWYGSGYTIEVTRPVTSA